jgi:formylglycine-generating enzyme required for sulfatase activity
LLGADWRHPEGPDSNLGGRELHPVTHVASECATYTWGEEFAPKGR